MPFCVYCGGVNKEAFRCCVHCGRHATSAVVIRPPVQSSVAAPPPPPPTPVSTPAYPTTLALPQEATQPETPAVSYSGWLAKNKIWLLSVPAVVVVGLLAYRFLFKKDPAEEAQLLALKECACAQQRIQDATRLKRAFLVNFKSYGFADGDAAQQSYDSLQAVLNAAADSCAGANRDAYNELVGGFKNPQQFASFEESYASAMNKCNVQNNSIAELDGKAQKMIRDIRQQQVAQQPDKGQEAYQRMMDGILKDVLPGHPVSTAGGAAVPDVVAHLYAAENAIQTEGDIEAVLDYYEYPLTRYYDAYNVDRGRLAKIYYESYFNALRRHRVYGFENNIQTETLPGGDARLTIGYRFEFSTREAPADVRTKTATNIYILSPAGKIKSVYQP